MSTQGGGAQLATPSIASPPTAMTAAAFMGIAWYLALELNIRAFLTFTRRGLYFWSCLLCSWGIIFHVLSICLTNFQIWNHYTASVAIEVTWIVYVGAQSVILYSRLHLVVHRWRNYRWVLPMICLNIGLVGGANFVVALVSMYPSMAKYRKLNQAMMNIDKVQVAAFFTVETVLSLLYIKETRHFLSVTALCRNSKTNRRVLLNLIWVNIFIICLDIAVLGVCYAGFFFLQGYFKAAVYAIKLRVEFVILNSLLSVVESTARNSNGSPKGQDGDTARSGNMWGLRKSAKTEEGKSAMSNDDEENCIKREDTIFVESGPPSAETSTDSARDWGAGTMSFFREK